MSLSGELDRSCPICDGEMQSRGSDICCIEEDGYLLAELRAFMRSNPKAGVNVGEVVEHLYEHLRPYLTRKKIDLDQIDPNEVFVELEKRILRWVSRGDISITSVSGLSVCQTCGAPIMRGRTQCNNCLRGKEIAGLQPAPSPTQSISRGMHTRHRR